MEDPAKTPKSTLVIAIEAQDVAAVQRLLSEGADANAIHLPPERNGWDEERWPVLVYAARLGNADIVRALLDAGANLEAQWELDAYHWPDGYEGAESMGDALFVAAAAGRFDVVELLLQRGARTRAAAREVAVRNDHLAVAERLASQEAKPRKPRRGKR